MNRKPRSFAKRIFAILLVIPVGYTFFKFNLPNPTITKFDEVLRYLFPILIALAFIVDNWDRTENTTQRIVKCTLILVAASIMGIFHGLGKRVDENKILGMILVGAILCSMSSISFYFASFQNRSLFVDDPLLSKIYRFAIICFILSFMQIPLGSMFTGHFPPRGFSRAGEIIATIGVILSLIGPASPWLIGFFRELIEINKKSRDSRK